MALEFGGTINPALLENIGRASITVENPFSGPVWLKLLNEIYSVDRRLSILDGMTVLEHIVGIFDSDAENKEAAEQFTHLLLFYSRQRIWESTRH